METNDVIGVLAGVFTTIAVLPQISKALKTKQVKDVSPFMFIILCLGVSLWVVYGVMKWDWPIIITNSISLILNGTMLTILLTQKQH